jgi:hypothetical protein
MSKLRLYTMIDVSGMEVQVNIDWIGYIAKETSTWKVVLSDGTFVRIDYNTYTAFAEYLSEG